MSSFSLAVKLGDLAMSKRSISMCQTGRSQLWFDTLHMRPMSLFESRHSTGEVSLAALLRGETQRAGRSPLGVADDVGPVHPD